MTTGCQTQNLFIDMDKSKYVIDQDGLELWKDSNDQPEIEVIDNFLDRDTFERIKYCILYSECIDWKLCNNISGLPNMENNMDCYFWHNFFHDHTILSPYFNDLVRSFILPLKIRSFIRVKANLYPRTDILVEHPPHVDYPFSHKGAIFYLNTNDGFTMIGDTKVESIENRLLKFDPFMPHNSTNCTNTAYRANINFNYN